MQPESSNKINSLASGGAIEQHAIPVPDRMRLPMCTGRVVADARPPGTAPVSPEQVGGDAALVEEHIVPPVPQRQPVSPAAPLSGDVATTLLVRVDRF